MESNCGTLTNKIKFYRLCIENCLISHTQKRMKPSSVHFYNKKIRGLTCCMSKYRKLSSPYSVMYLVTNRTFQEMSNNSIYRTLIVFVGVVIFVKRGSFTMSTDESIDVTHPNLLLREM